MKTSIYLMEISNISFVLTQTSDPYFAARGAHEPRQSEGCPSCS